MRILFHLNNIQMKKFIAALTLFLAFTINASAQDKKATTSHDLAQKDAIELATFLKLDQTSSDNFLRLFELKYKTLEDKTLSDERKKSLSNAIEAKIRATLDGVQMEKLEKNKALFTKLIN